MCTRKYKVHIICQQTGAQEREPGRPLKAYANSVLGEQQGPSPKNRTIAEKRINRSKQRPKERASCGTCRKGDKARTANLDGDDLTMQF